MIFLGWYTTITLAVYGILTANIAEQVIQPVVAPSLPPQTNPLPTSNVQQILPVTSIKNEWNQEPNQAVSMEYSQQPTAAYPQTYVQQDQFQHNYGMQDYYGEMPKDPRSYHNTPEAEWENKGRDRSMDRDRDRDRDRGRDSDRYLVSIYLMFI